MNSHSNQNHPQANQQASNRQAQNSPVNHSMDQQTALQAILASNGNLSQVQNSHQNGNVSNLSFNHPCINIVQQNNVRNLLSQIQPGTGSSNSMDHQRNAQENILRSSYSGVNSQENSNFSIGTNKSNSNSGSMLNNKELQRKILTDFIHKK